MNTGKFLQTSADLAKNLSPNLLGKPTLNLTTIRNFITKTTVALPPILTSNHNP